MTGNPFFLIESIVTQLMAFKDTDNLVIAGLINGNVNIWNITDKIILNTIEGFNGNPISGMFLVTLVGTTPEIYIMAYSHKDKNIKWGNVDGKSLVDLKMSHNPAFSNCGFPSWQILDCDTDRGFSFMTITNFNDRNPAVSIWSLHDK